MAKRNCDHPDFPLHKSAGRYWARKFGKSRVYFGRIDADPEGVEAWRLHDAELELRLAGHDPRKTPGEDTSQDPTTLTVAQLADEYAEYQRRRLHDQEDAPTPGHVRDLVQCAALFVTAIGRSRIYAALRPGEFGKVRELVVASFKAPSTRQRTLINVGTFLNWIADHYPELPKPATAKNLRSPSKRSRKVYQRNVAIAKGADPNRDPAKARAFDAAEIKQVLAAATCPQLRAQILLGLNGGVYPRELAMMTFDQFTNGGSWYRGWRNKTGEPRRFPLWAETQHALLVAREARKEPNDPQYADRVFITSRGGPYYSEWLRVDENGVEKWNKNQPAINAFARIVKRLGINEGGRSGRGMGGLRYSFTSAAERCPASHMRDSVNIVMGHRRRPEDEIHYRYADYPDDRIAEVVNFVHDWFLNDGTI